MVRPHAQVTLRAALHPGTCSSVVEDTSVCDVERSTARNYIYHNTYDRRRTGPVIDLSVTVTLPVAVIGVRNAYGYVAFIVFINQQ